LSFVIAGWLIVSLLHLGAFGIHSFKLSDDYPEMDTIGTNYQAYNEGYHLLSLSTVYDKSKSEKIIRTVKVNNQFYDFDNLNLDSNNRMRLNIKEKIIEGNFSENRISLEITKKQFLTFRDIGKWYSLIFFLLQTLFAYFIFRIGISYCRNKFFSKKNSNRLLYLGIVTVLIGGNMYFKGLIQQFVVNNVTGSCFRIFPLESWEFFPYILIIGLFIIVVSGFYKDAVALKKQNDLTI